MTEAHTATLALLRGILGDAGLLTDAESRQKYGRDWTRVHEPAPCAVAFPRSTEEVAQVVVLARKSGLAIVPSGGRTGLAGGAVAKDGELVLSLERMNRIGAVDVVGMTVDVEAGAITEAVHHAASEHGLTWPVDFASKGSSHVGGNLSTNAGGVKVIRYGLTRQWVLGLTVVTGAGEVLQLGGALEKDNTGVPLRQLFVGSEGTLGIITEATLKLAPVPGHLDVFLFAVQDLAAILTLFGAARRGPFDVMAFEMMSDRSLARLERHRGVRPPIETEAPYYVLLEVESSDPDTLSAWLEDIVERELVLDGTLAANLEQARALWTLREGISESLSGTGMPHKNDVALPIRELPAFCASLQAVFDAEYPDFEICLFGHIGDGNLHVNVMKPDAMDHASFLERVHDADRTLMELVAKHHGSVSAEHGIGLLKRPWLRYSRSEGEIALMRAMKAVFDPDGILNPGKVFG